MKRAILSFVVGAAFAVACSETDIAGTPLNGDGFEQDAQRPHAYRWRDWVIAAVNRDMPFDQFTIEQLAGDLLPNATPEQLLATGFHRNAPTNREGGIDKEEARVRTIVDRVSTTGTVWLGLTVGCAECHAHKFDPLRQSEFYQLYAFFNDAADFINDYRGAHLDLEWDDVDAVFERIHREIKAAKRTGALTVVSRTIH